MRLWAVAVAVAAAAAAVVAAPLDEPVDESSLRPALLHQPRLKWWQTGVVYQIYPASFKDSDGDGIGDLPGITSKLEYLQKLGIAALWLSPIFDSPNKDMGYDISNYKDIHPNYGNLTDFDDMVAKAHSLGLKVILDFVPNHSSDEHRWFQEALKGEDNPYHDYYVWHEGEEVEGKVTPPTNWGSVFHNNEPGSAWQWVPALKKYYYRTFHEGQPDLNYRNPKVVTEMKNVFRFWARRGVDGFRIDAIPYLFEDALLRDNSQGGNERTENLPETYDMVRQWRDVFEEEGRRLGKDLVMMLEAYANVEQTMKYYGSKDFPAGHFPFNFQFISAISSTSPAEKYKDIIEEWEKNKPNFGWSNWVMGNHDNHRVSSRLGAGRVDGLNALLLLLGGTAVSYYGEELGMQDNAALLWADCRDPQACPDDEALTGAAQADKEAFYKEHSRDYERTPFHWDDSEHAGFTTGTPWLPVAEDYKLLNVKTEEADATSHLSVYKRLVQLRGESVVQTGSLHVQTEGNVVTVLRQNDTYSLLVLVNLNSEQTPSPINAVALHGYMGDLDVLVASNFDAETVDLMAITLKANAAVVLGGPRYKWWQTGSLYHVYTPSFKDAVGEDGIGDIKGITSKLEYLKDLGISAIRLSPIHESPKYDVGTKTSDFTEVHEDYGTMDDFKEMTEKAHSLGLKVVMHLVPNHASSNHKWFNDVEKYENYFVWQPYEKNDEGEPVYPNNWQVVGSDSPAWECITEEDKVNSGQCYLHQFDVNQPDLNYRNPKVVEEMENVIKFWIDVGVDGFYMETVPYLFEDVGFASNSEGSDKVVNQPETLKMVKEWRKLLDKEGKANKKDLVLILEVNDKAEVLKQYYGDATEPGSHFPLNVLFVEDLKGKIKVEEVAASIKQSLGAVPEHGWANWMVGSQDAHRIGSRTDPHLIDAFNMLTTLLPGTALTYYGEEIGMLDNSDLTFEKCKDHCPEDSATAEEKEKYYKENSHDFERCPMQWSKGENAGFCSAGVEAWLPLPEKVDDVNVEEEAARRRSHLFVYKRLSALRLEPAVQSGALSVDALSSDVLCVARKNDTYSYVVVINFGDEEVVVNVAEKHENVGTVKVYTSSGFTATEVDLSALRLPSKASVVLEGALRKASTEPEDLKWWQTGVIYQIYPRSFQDSDGDGIGDLPGITSRLEYLRDIGVTGVWMSPIFSSPDADMGYDISDFQDISELYGNLGDFDELVQEAHRLGLKVILDFVPNHSSDEHPWFQHALKNGKNSPYYDYYVWAEGKDEGKEPPNNWVGAFTMDVESSAWSKHKDAKEDAWYLHQFHEKQPDLNYRNPELVQAMKDVLSFWVRRGVDGFRVDAIQHLVEDEALRDNTGAKDRDMQLNQPLTHEIIKQWHDLLRTEGARLQKDLVIMLEVYTNVEDLMPYFGEELRPAGDFPFNFFGISELNKNTLNANSVIEVINKWELNKPSFGWSNWVFGNHDNHRVGSRLQPELVDAMNMLTMLLPGTAISYNGEELGMLNNDELRWADCQDPQACPDDDDLTGSTQEEKEQYYAAHTRDYERTPFQWDDSEHAGFTSGTPWLKVHQNHATVNVRSEEADPSSHLNVYKKLAALRHEMAVQRGDFHLHALSNNVLSFSRRNVSHAYVVVINFGSAAAEVNLKAVSAYKDLPKMLKYTSSANFGGEEGAEVDASKVALPGYAAVVLTSEPVRDDEDFGDPPAESTTLGATAATAPMALLGALALGWTLLRASLG